MPFAVKEVVATTMIAVAPEQPIQGQEYIVVEKPQNCYEVVVTSSDYDGRAYEEIVMVCD